MSLTSSLPSLWRLAFCEPEVLPDFVSTLFDNLLAHCDETDMANYLLFVG